MARVPGCRGKQAKAGKNEGRGEREEREGWDRRVGRKRRGAGVRARASASSVYMCTRALLACPCLSRHHLIVGVSSH